MIKENTNSHQITLEMLENHLNLIYQDHANKRDGNDYSEDEFKDALNREIDINLEIARYLDSVYVGKYHDSTDYKLRYNFTADLAVLYIKSVFQFFISFIKKDRPQSEHEERDTETLIQFQLSGVVNQEKVISYCKEIIRIDIADHLDFLEEKHAKDQETIKYSTSVEAEEVVEMP